MLALLHDTAVLGVTTNRLFLMQCVNHPEFRSAKFTTRFIGDHFPDGTRDGAMRVATQPAQVEAALFAACAWDWHKAAKLRATSRLRGVPGGWRNGASYAPLRRLYEAPSGDGSELVAIEYELQNDGIGKPPVFRMRTLPGGVAAPTGPTTAWRPVELVSVAAPAAAGAHPAGRDDAGHGEAVIAVNGLRQRYAFAEGAKGCFATRRCWARSRCRGARARWKWLPPTWRQTAATWRRCPPRSSRLWWRTARQ